MGNSSSSQRAPKRRKSAVNGWYKIRDNFTCIDDVVQGMRNAGLESSNLIIGVDLTKSNEWNGKNTFQGRCLHQQDPHFSNPYEEVIDIISRALSPFDDDDLYPLYGFGDSKSSSKSVMSFTMNEDPCKGVQDALYCYKSVIPHVKLAGPTTFGPLIRKSIDIVDEDGSYHILVIIADGQVTRPSSTDDGSNSIFEQDTIDAIVEASNYPLSIVMVGVGDGPWDMMKNFDDRLPDRRFDNFQFVNFNTVRMSARDVKRREARFALDAMMEIPEQYTAIQSLGLLGRSNISRRPKQTVLNPPMSASHSLSQRAAHLQSAVQPAVVASVQAGSVSQSAVPVAVATAVPAHDGQYGNVPLITPR